MKKSTLKLKSKTKKKLTLPKEKDQYAFLADLKLIKFYNYENKVKTIKFYDSDPWSLIWNPVTKQLLGIKNSLLKCVEIKSKKLFSLPAMKSYIAFQDHKDIKDYDFSKNFISSLTLPIKWNLLGKAKQIDYYSDKFNINDYWLYYHRFGEYDQSMPIVKDHKVQLYYDCANQIIKIEGGKLIVTERGIIN